MDTYDKDLTPVEGKPGWFHGWGVLRHEPFHLAGVFKSQAYAQEQTAKAGEYYEVKRGIWEKGSTDFQIE